MTLGERLKELATQTGGSIRQMENHMTWGETTIGSYTFKFEHGYTGEEGGEAHTDWIGSITDNVTGEIEYYNITGTHDSWSDGYTDYDYAERVYPKFDDTVRTYSHQSIDYHDADGHCHFSLQVPCKTPTEKYLEDSARTTSKLAEEHSVITNEDLASLLTGVAAGHLNDALKRKLFYRDPNWEDRAMKAMEVTEKQIVEIATVDKEYKLTEKQLDILHAIAGLISEVGELAEDFVNSILEGRDIDNVNFIEEIGDQNWYQALGLRAVGGTFDNAMTTNIKKLQKRYPNNFTSKAAVVRDLEEERKLLEENAKIK